MGPVQLMSAVHLALKARLLPDGVIWAKLWRDHAQHWGARFREDERLEYRPGRTQDRETERNLQQAPADVREKCWQGKLYRSVTDITPS